ncbi:hypothetical protein PMAYCL1PPCAC_12049, partial [Pristionchus mayeri]
MSSIKGFVYSGRGRERKGVMEASRRALDWRRNAAERGSEDSSESEQSINLLVDLLSLFESMEHLFVLSGGCLSTRLQGLQSLAHLSQVSETHAGSGEIQFDLLPRPLRLLLLLLLLLL